MRTLILFIIILIPHISNAQLTDNLSYDEIPVTVNVQRVGSLEIPAVIHAVSVYLPIKELFDFLQIKNIQSPGLDSVYGFFIHPEAKYLVDKIRSRIEYAGKVYQIKAGDLIRTETNLYLKSDYFREVFGLDCQFNFRSLSVTLITKIELPAIRIMQQELMRENISTLKGEKKADTTIQNSFSAFRLGMADWRVNAIQQTNHSNSTTLNLGLGGMVAGGEANVSLNYTTSLPFNANQQYYSWRYVNNDNAVIRQINGGKIFAQSVSTIYAPITGIQFSNTPTKYRKSFGSYRLSDKTEPGWMVELYVNNVLVNYKKADASGFFTFDVPLIYGNSVVKLRAYGPWGEEQVKEQYISLPFNFLPLHQFEYSGTAGIVSDTLKSKYARADLNYGLGTHITIGAGIEYLSSVTSGKSMPFINSSIRFGTNLLVTAEHTAGVRSKGIISYRLPSGYQFDFNYTEYDKSQTAIKFNYLAQRELRISKAFHGPDYAFFTRFSLSQFRLPKSKYSTAEFLISGIIAGISSNLTTTSTLNDNSAYINSNLSLTFKLPAGMCIIPQAQYDFSQKNFSMLTSELRKQISNRGYVNLSYQRDNLNKSSMFSIGMRFNFSFTQTAFSAIQSGDNITTNESASGSLMYDRRSNYLGARRSGSVGKGGVIISSFLDLNCNGKREPNEPKLGGLKIHVNGGLIEHNTRDTTLRISGLEAYNSYLIEVDKNSFDNIAWQIKNPTIRITIEPNHFKFIEVAVCVVGEVSGTVYVNDKKELKGTGGFIINIYDTASNKITSTLSESDGYFSYMGLAPGNYTVRIDSVQLHKLQITSSPAISFKVDTNKEGDIVDGLQFLLCKISDSLSNIQDDKTKNQTSENKMQSENIRESEVSLKKPETSKIAEKNKSGTLNLNPLISNDKAFRKDKQLVKKYRVDSITAPVSKNHINGKKVKGGNVKELKGTVTIGKKVASTLKGNNRLIKKLPPSFARPSKNLKSNSTQVNKLKKATDNKAIPPKVQKIPGTFKKSAATAENAEMDELIKALKDEIEKMKEVVNEWINMF